MVSLNLLLLSLSVCLTWGQGMRDTYICEEDNLGVLACPAGKSIEVMKVLYGRQRMDQCNAQRKTLPIHCYSQLATTYVMNQCNSSKSECVITSVKLFDQSEEVRSELKNKEICFPPGAETGVARIYYKCKEPTKIRPPKEKAQLWHLKTRPRMRDFSAYEGEPVNLSCIVTFTDINTKSRIEKDLTIRWEDGTAGNNLYDSSKEGSKERDRSRYSVRNDFGQDVLRTTLTIKSLRRPIGQGFIVYGCDFRRNNDKNNPKNSRFNITVLPTTTTSTTVAPTTTTVTTATVSTASTESSTSTQRAPVTTNNRCRRAKSLGIDLCSLHATCTDFRNSYRCRCNPGFTGDGHVEGACGRAKEALRTSWDCRRAEASSANASCVSKKLLDMQKSFPSLDLTNQLDEVKAVTKDGSFSAQELRILTDVLDIMVTGFDEPQDPHYRSMLKSPNVVSQVVVNASSRLINNTAPWQHQPPKQRRAMAMNVTQVVEKTMMATTRVSGKMDIADPLIDVKVESVPERETRLVFQPDGGGDEVQLFTKGSGSTYRTSTDTPRAVFIRYKGIRKLLGKDEAEARENATGPAIVVISHVVSATLSQPGLVRKIQLRLTHSAPPNSSVATRRCAFWNQSTEAWDFGGCRMLSANASRLSVCECEHLTSFAVLLDYKGSTLKMSEAHRLSLSIITYIGCILSIFCCIFGVWTYDILRRSKGDRMNSEGRTSFIIYEMICLSLLFAQTIFLMGIFHTKDEILCKIVAAALHYFFLLLFEWMLMAGVYYILVYTQPYSIAALDSHRCAVMITLLLLPAVVVGVSLGVRLEGYGTPNHCWLSVEDGLIWAFVGPVTVMLAVNMILLSILIVLTWRIKPSDMLESGEVNKGWVTSRARKLRYELLFCIVLGATWTFGYFLIEDTSSLVFSYIFAILNSLQGVFILISYANWSRIRAAYIAEFRRKRWLPESFRRWLHSRQYSPGGPPGVGMVGSSASATASQRTRSGRGSGSHRGLLSGTVNAHASVSSGGLSHTTRTTRLGSGSSGGAKWSISAGGMRGMMDANDNSVAMVTETEGAYNENYAGHSMMDEPRQVFSDFDDRMVSEFASQSDADILTMTASMPLREHEEGGDHRPARYSSSSSSSVASSASTTSPSSSYSDEAGRGHVIDDLPSEPPKLPVVCSVPSPFAVHHSAANGDCAGQPGGSVTAPRMARRAHDEEENDYLMPTTRLQRHTLDCRARDRDDVELRASVTAKQKRFSNSDLYANADDVVYYSEPPLEPSTLERGAMGLSRVTDV